MSSLKASFLLLMDTQATLTTEDSMGCRLPQPCFVLMGAFSQANVLGVAGEGDSAPTLVGPSSF